jgi:hypothetical protein
MSLWSRVAYAVRCSPLARSRCRQAAGMLQKQLDGTLDPIATTLLRAHLAGCRQCGLEAEVYTRLKESSRRRPAPAESVRRLDTFARRLVEEGDSSPGS